VRHQQSEFAEFYAAARDDCLRAVLASTGDWQAAEVCVAEAFARAWASWRTVRAHPAPRAWVVRTALNHSVSRWRRRREVPLGPGADRAGSTVAVQGSDLRIQTAKLSGQSHLQGTIAPAGLPVIVRMNPPGGGQSCARPHVDIAEHATATPVSGGPYTEGEGHVLVRFAFHPSVIPAGDAVEITLITSFDPAGPLPPLAFCRAVGTAGQGGRQLPAGLSGG
jgi:hypothetical protein